MHIERLVYSVVYKHKLANYNTALLNYERYLDSLIFTQINDLNNIDLNLSAIVKHINATPPLSKL